MSSKAPLPRAANTSKELQICISLVPALEATNFDVWKKAVGHLKMLFQWDDAVLNPRGAKPKDADKFADDMRLAYMAIFTTTAKLYSYLLEDVPEGDSSAAFTAICEDFQSTTTGGYVAASDAFTSSNMVSDQVAIGEFIALVSKRAKEFQRQGGNVDEKAKIAVLLKGLLPQFNTKKDSLYDQDISTLTWATVVKQLKSYATHQNIKDLRNGNTSSKNTFAISAGQEECRNWAKYGECKYRNCKFQHVGPARKDRDGNDNETCSYCGKKNHKADVCFKKRNDEKKGASKDDLKSELVTMIAEMENLKARIHETEDQGYDSGDSGGYTMMTATYITKQSYEGEFSSTISPDSATSNHVTNDESILIPSTLRQVKINVKIGDGTTTCEKMGTMMATGKNGKQIKFQNTMLLPNCARILISESKMDLAGCSINKPGGGIVRVRHVKSGELLMEGSLDSRSGLYSFKDLKFEKHTQAHLHATTKTNEQVQNAMQRAREGQLASRDATTTAEAESQLQLHRIHAHASLDLLRQQYGIANIGKIDCDDCIVARAKWSKISAESSKPKAELVLQRLHTDICFGRGSRICWQLTVDEKSRRHWAQKMPDKSRCLETFDTLVKHLENERAPLKVAFHRTDAESVYATTEWKQYRKDKGIEHEPNAPYRKESIIERAAQTVGEGARASMLHGNAPDEDMFDAIEHKVFCINNTYHSAHTGKLRTPLEVWHGIKLRTSRRLQKAIIFCLCYAILHADQRGKFDPRSFPCVYLGLSMTLRGYKVRDLRTGKKRVVADIIPIVRSFPYRQNPSGMLSALRFDAGEIIPDMRQEMGRQYAEEDWVMRLAEHAAASKSATKNFAGEGVNSKPQLKLLDDSSSRDDSFHDGSIQGNAEAATA
jgi:hypothetical protein